MITLIPTLNDICLHENDLYDVEARQYDAAAPVFNRPDDHATSYYPISPYAYCAGDPVNCIDPTGKWIAGIDGKPVVVTGNRLSKNAYPDTHRVWKSLQLTRTGTETFMSIVNNEERKTTINISPEEKKVDGLCVYGETSYKGKPGIRCTETNITIFEGSIKAGIKNNIKNTLKQAKNGFKKDLPVQVEEIVGGTFVHESVHSEDKESNGCLSPESKDREIKPRETETQFYKELDDRKIEPVIQ